MWLRFPSSFLMKTATFISILIVVCSCTYGQNLIGYKDAEIRKFMQQNRKDMHSNTVRNSMFNYLKYSNNSDSQTILFFLTKDSICKSVRVICENSMKCEKIKELNANYKRIADNKWVDTQDGKNYLINFMEEEWSCSITIEPEI